MYVRRCEPRDRGEAGCDALVLIHGSGRLLHAATIRDFVKNPDRPGETPADDYARVAAHECFDKRSSARCRLQWASEHDVRHCDFVYAGEMRRFIKAVHRVWPYSRD